MPHPLPKNWPPNLPFLTAPLLSPLCPHSVPLTRTPGPSPLVRIRRITAASHPANGQYGLFAARRLVPRSHVVDYLGYYHTEAEADADSDYDIHLDRELGVAVDARCMGNEARFVNDYRGVMERDNCVFEVEGGRVRVVVGHREVKRGEELCASYGKGFWEGRKEQDTRKTGERNGEVKEKVMKKKKKAKR